jgi:actin-related protein
MKIQPLYCQEDSTMNFDVLEELLDKSLCKNLMLQPKDTPLILTENSMHQKDARLKLTEFMFEKLEVPAIFICKDSVLTSFACGRSTALVLDSGYKTTTATPVHDGYAL